MVVAAAVCLLLTLSGCEYGRREGRCSEFFEVIAEGDLAKVREMLDAGADPNMERGTGIRPLHMAAARDRPAIVALLLERGAPVDGRDEAGATALDCAAEEGAHEAMRVLLAAGADPNAKMWGAADGDWDRDKSRDGWRPLDFAAEMGDLVSARMLLAAGAGPDARDAWGLGPLYRAIGGGNGQLARELLRHGAHWDLFSACLLGEVVEAEAILRSRPRLVNSHDGDGLTPLHCAARGGQEALAAGLLAKGARVNALDADGGTPLIEAAAWGHTGVVRLLLEAGADLHPKDHYGNTAFTRAAVAGSTDACKLLLDTGYVPSADEFIRAFRDAATVGNIEAARLLAGLGSVDVVVDDELSTPLYLAVTFAHSDLAAFLLAAGADPNKAVLHGYTPLHEAARRSDLEIAKLLVASGARLDLKNSSGQTPLDVAIRSHATEVASCLQSIGTSTATGTSSPAP